MARIGKVVQVIGPVIDVEFTGGLPEIYNAVRIVSEAKPGVEAIDVVAEVEQHLGENRVRTVAMKPTDGMTRGMEVIDTGAPITVPVGPETSAASTTCSASRWTTRIGRCSRRSGRSIAMPRRSRSSPPSCACSRPASR